MGRSVALKTVRKELRSDPTIVRFSQHIILTMMMMRKTVMMMTCTYDDDDDDNDHVSGTWLPSSG